MKRMILKVKTLLKSLYMWVIEDEPRTCPCGTCNPDCLKAVGG